MSTKKKKSKSKKLHVTFNKKEFLASESIRSMAAVHTKILADGIAILRVSDCNTSVRIWNDFNNKEEVKEMLLKVGNLRAVLYEFEQEIKSRL